MDAILQEIIILFQKEIYSSVILDGIKANLEKLDPSFFPNIPFEIFFENLCMIDEKALDIFIIILNSPSKKRLINSKSLDLINWRKIGNYPENLFIKIIHILHLINQDSKIDKYLHEILLSDPRKLLLHEYAIEEFLYDFNLDESTQTAEFIRIVIYKHSLTDRYLEIFKKYPKSFNSILDLDVFTILNREFHISDLISLLDSKYNNLEMLEIFFDFLISENVSIDYFMAIYHLLNVQKSWTDFVEPSLTLFKNYFVFGYEKNQYIFISDLLLMVISTIANELLHYLVEDFLIGFIRENINEEPLIDAIDELIFNIDDNLREKVLENLELHEFQNHQKREELIILYM